MFPRSLEGFSHNHTSSTQSCSPPFSGVDLSFHLAASKVTGLLLGREIVCPKHCKDSTRQGASCRDFFEPRPNVMSKQQPLKDLRINQACRIYNLTFVTRVTYLALDQL